ncbi:MAG: hypothetical protein AAF927_23740 [Bacteroidota bacterium]
MEESIAAVISLLGVGLSVFFSVRASRRETEIELNKLKQENKLAYTPQILEKRLERYPQLYRIISTYQNLIRVEGISSKNLKRLYEDMLEWEYENAILVSSRTKMVLLDLYKQIRCMIRDKEKDPNMKVRKEVIRCLSQLELNLKGDLGIFVVEFPEGDKDYFDSYLDLADAVKEARQKDTPEEEKEEEEEPASATSEL